jgi:hypothetical protein
MNKQTVDSNKVQVGSVLDLGVRSADVQQFYETNWQRKIALSDPDFYRWQFVSSPDNHDKDYCCVAIDQAGYILGVMGLNQRRYWLEGVEKQAAELTTWVVGPKAQGLGLGGRMLSYLQSNYDVLMGMGITDSALVLYLGHGFKFIAHIPRYVRVFNLENLRDFSVCDWAGERLVKKRSEFGTFNNAENATLEHVDICDKLMHDDFNQYSRSRDHFKWRYLDHPVFDYQSFYISNRGKGAIIVLRVDQVGNMRMAHIMDIFGDMDEMPDVVSFVDTFCRDNEISFADFYCTTPKITRYLALAGWFSTLDEKCFQMYHLFSPPELRSPPTTSLTYWSKDNMIGLADTSYMYITKEDLDLDRPTGACLDMR